MKQSPKIGKINPILKIRIDNIQHQIDMIDDNYAFDDKYKEAYRGVRNALMNQKRLLVNKT